MADRLFSDVDADGDGTVIVELPSDVIQNIDTVNNRQFDGELSQVDVINWAIQNAAQEVVDTDVAQTGELIVEDIGGSR